MIPIRMTRGRGEMTKTPIHLQDLRRRIYRKAKAEPSWRFWGLFVHVCKMETLNEAYRLTKRKDGAPGVDGVTFRDIERTGSRAFLEQLRNELLEAARNQGTAVRRREDLHRMAEANRAFVHYRW